MGLTMRTILTIDDQLFAKAKAVALAKPGIYKSELIRECIEVFIQHQTTRRLTPFDANMHRALKSQAGQESVSNKKNR